MKLSTWPIFIAAPFMPPSTVTICFAASTWRRSIAASAFSSERVTFAARVPVCLHRLRGGGAADLGQPLDPALGQLLVGHRLRPARSSGP